MSAAHACSSTVLRDAVDVQLRLEGREPKLLSKDQIPVVDIK